MQSPVRVIFLLFFNLSRIPRSVVQQAADARHRYCPLISLEVLIEKPSTLLTFLMCKILDGIQFFYFKIDFKGR